jgi:hypothetical protein
MAVGAEPAGEQLVAIVVGCACGAASRTRGVAVGGGRSCDGAVGSARRVTALRRLHHDARCESRMEVSGEAYRHRNRRVVGAAIADRHGCSPLERQLGGGEVH